MYYLRESRIVAQVQKMNSLEEVRSEFRTGVDPSVLQYHEIDALASPTYCESAATGK